MYPVPGICPVCGDHLVATRLHCGRCATTLEGLFTLGRFHYLTREQQQFIGIFIKCRGKIKDVEQSLGISYPTVVRMLDEVVDALGLEEVEEVPDAVPTLALPELPTISFEQRRTILDDLSQGRITSADALRLLQGDGTPAPAPLPEPAPTSHTPAESSDEADVAPIEEDNK